MGFHGTNGTKCGSKAKLRQIGIFWVILMFLSAMAPLSLDARQRGRHHRPDKHRYRHHDSRAVAYDDDDYRYERKRYKRKYHKYKDRKHKYRKYRSHHHDPRRGHRDCNYDYYERPRYRDHGYYHSHDGSFRIRVMGPGWGFHVSRD